MHWLTLLEDDYDEYRVICSLKFNYFTLLFVLQHMHQNILILHSTTDATTKMLKLLRHPEEEPIFIQLMKAEIKILEKYSFIYLIFLFRVF